jgi:glycosyltransferase involved in cell wall biosynthesis
MKTIVIAHNFDTNSFAAMSHGLAHHLADNGFRVVFISHFPYFDKPETIKKQNGEIIVCSWPTKKRPTNFVDFWWFTKLYFQYKPDFVLGHFVGSNIAILLSKILSFGKTKTFEYYHTISGAIISDVKKVGLKQKWLFFRKKMFYRLFCDTIFCPSNIAKKDLETFFEYSKGIVILNPISDRNTKLTLHKNQNIIISYLGRLDPTKGVLEMILAFQNYNFKNPNSNVLLQIAGGGSLEKQVSDLVKDEHYIQFFGGLPYSKIDEYLRASHYTIIPSKFDNLPTVGLESLMLGRPLLISSSTGLTKYVTDSVNAFVFDFDLKEIENVFEKAALSFSNIHSLSNNARILFEKKFTMKQYFETITPFFQ